ncbi:Uncharacterised protein [Actinobacillus equuli]|nr:Uncharacterised protein [Actinobacillus equuli]
MPTLKEIDFSGKVIGILVVVTKKIMRNISVTQWELFVT